MKEYRSKLKKDADPIDGVTRSSINKFIADFDDHKYDTIPDEALKESQQYRRKLNYTAPLTTVGFYNSTQISIDEERLTLLRKLDAIVKDSKGKLAILAANKFISHYSTGRYEMTPNKALKKLKEIRAMFGENRDQRTMIELEKIEKRLKIKFDLLSGGLAKGSKKP